MIPLMYPRMLASMMSSPARTRTPAPRNSSRATSTSCPVYHPATDRGPHGRVRLTGDHPDVHAAFRKLPREGREEAFQFSERERSCRMRCATSSRYLSVGRQYERHEAFDDRPALSSCSRPRAMTVAFSVSLNSPCTAVSRILPESSSVRRDRPLHVAALQFHGCAGVGN